jgi:hypothetical protein
MARKPDDDDLRWLLRRQDGVVARRQLLEFGASDWDIARLIRRKTLTVIRPGVYVEHTGRPSRLQEEWAAVLALWPAALSHQSALPGGTLQKLIHVAVDADRTVTQPTGVNLIHTAGLWSRVNEVQSPPKVKPEHAVIDVVSGMEREDQAFEVIANALATREVSIRTLRRALADRNRIRHRRRIGAMLDDLDTGANSVLERGFLRLERAHGLPAGRRQVRETAGGVGVARDVLYDEWGLVVELDGKPFHDNARARDRDAGRDLAALVELRRTSVRLTYGLVFRDGCRTIANIGLLLHRLGRPELPSRCPQCA